MLKNTPNQSSENHPSGFELNLRMSDSALAILLKLLPWFLVLLLGTGAAGLWQNQLSPPNPIASEVTTSIQR